MTYTLLAPAPKPILLAYHDQVTMQNKIVEATSAFRDLMIFQIGQLIEDHIRNSFSVIVDIFKLDEPLFTSVQ